MSPLGEGRSARGVLALASALCALALVAPAGAAAQTSSPLEGHDLIPWPQALPGADVPNQVQPRRVDHCRRGTIRCVAGLERRLRRQWRRFDSRCDHRAVIAYSYLQITRGLLADMRGARADALVRGRRYMSLLITNFSNRYFRAFRRHARGLPVTQAWRITFETAASGDAQAGQEVMLFSNAHVQHDLPFAYERMGVETRSGRSRKSDHDAVNEVNARVFDGIEEYIAANYDPSFNLIDVPFVPIEEVGVLELVKLWREQAWRSAERLLAANSPAERREVAARIRENATRWAEMISSGGFPGYRQARDEYCLTH
jgi:hypothetical protein